MTLQFRISESGNATIPVHVRTAGLPVIESQPRTLAGHPPRGGRASIGWAGWVALAVVTIAATILGMSAVAVAFWFLLRPHEPPLADQPSKSPVTSLVRWP